jgi:hypothetical protein
MGDIVDTGAVFAIPVRLFAPPFFNTRSVFQREDRRVATAFHRLWRILFADIVQVLTTLDKMFEGCINHITPRRVIVVIRGDDLFGLVEQTFSVVREFEAGSVGHTKADVCTGGAGALISGEPKRVSLSTHARGRLAHEQLHEETRANLCTDLA